MTSPRRQIVDPVEAGFYHCISRCVRRAFLCGADAVSGRSFEHRKDWVEDRLLELAAMFAVGVYAYAVMSNHVHVVIYLAPGASLAWSPEEIAERWVRLFPVRAIDGRVDVDATHHRAQAMLGNPERLAECRSRLASLSWFMRCLNEPIARRANREDMCTGRFWEGRFKCQALLDDQAVLACMSYVDLNPVRAGVVPDLASSGHTAIKRRLDTGTPAIGCLPPIAASVPAAQMPLDEVEYVMLVDWTGRIARPDKRGAIATDAPPALARLDVDADAWHQQVLGIESRYWRAVGAAEALLDKARRMGQCWLKGVAAAKGAGGHRDRSATSNVPTRAAASPASSG